MDNTERFLTINKSLEDRLDLCINIIDSRLNKTCRSSNHPFVQYDHESYKSSTVNRQTGFSCLTFMSFKSPYIRDFRAFRGPINDEVKQIQDLAGVDNVDALVRNKSWSKDSRQQLREVVLDHYSQLHIVELIKQKNNITRRINDSSSESSEDLNQKLSLIEEQIKQVKSRKEQRFFVPEDRNDKNIDWCAISAKLCGTDHNSQDCRLMWSNQLHWSINDQTWTKEEEECLLRAVDKHGKNNWDAVAKELNSGRLSWQCCERYQQHFANALSGSTTVTDDDSEKIVEVINLCRIGNYVPWNQVMYFIKYHNLLQVKYQWNKLLAERQSNQPWSHHEDVLLLKLVERFGDKDWNRISNYIAGRSNKSCRERYTMRLRFYRRAVGSWRKREDTSLLSLVAKFGTNWSLISYHFPERNSHQIRNRYELLKNDPGKVGPIKHKKLYRDAAGKLVSHAGSRYKRPSDCEVDKKLLEIFSTYQMSGTLSKSLVCRSAQDDSIYHSLVHVMRDIMVEQIHKRTLLDAVVAKAIEGQVSFKCELFSPCISTIRGYKAWTMQQDYLNQFRDLELDSDDVSDTEYHEILKIAMNLFLWPAILSRIHAPKSDATKFNARGIIERDSKNLYKIREIQKNISSSCNQT